MNIIICGAGEVGRYAAEVLAADGSSITIIDKDANKLAELDEVMDVRSLLGNGTQADVLLEAGCDGADLFLAATNIDEINLLSAAVASNIGAGRTIARVHHSAFFEHRGLAYDRALGIDHLVCPEHATAMAIAQTLRSPGALAVERFAHGRIEMQQLRIVENAPAVGKPLIALDMPRRSRIASIERGGSSFVPGGQTQIQADDVVTLIADTDVFSKAARMLNPDAGRRQRVIVLGGTAMGVWLCRALHGQFFSVRLIEQDRKRAEELAEKLDWVTVLRADAEDATLFEQEHVGEADAFVALTDDDEHNVLGAAHAKSLGAKVAIAVLQRPTYMHLLEHVGIDQAFSPRVTAVEQIRELLHDEPLRRVASLARNVAEVYEVRVPGGESAMVNQPLRALRLPPKTLIGAIQHLDEAHVPDADDVIEAGDTVIVIGPAGIDKELMTIFGIR